MSLARPFPVNLALCYGLTSQLSVLKPRCIAMLFRMEYLPACCQRQAPFALCLPRSDIMLWMLSRPLLLPIPSDWTPSAHNTLSHNRSSSPYNQPVAHSGRIRTQLQGTHSEYSRKTHQFA